MGDVGALGWWGAALGRWVAVLSAPAEDVGVDVWAGIGPALREGALVHRDKRANRFHTKGLNG